jgi:hypothetical protein
MVRLQPSQSMDALRSIVGTPSRPLRLAINAGTGCRTPARRQTDAPKAFDQVVAVPGLEEVDECLAGFGGRPSERHRPTGISLAATRRAWSSESREVGSLPATSPQGVMVTTDPLPKTSTVAYSFPLAHSTAAGNGRSANG